MRLLELFSGTKSVGRAFEALGWEVTSLDADATTRPTICTDVQAWDYGTYPPGHFDLIWASPVCTEFSRALTRRPRRLEDGDRLVLKTIEIIGYLRPRWWAVENPRTGLLKSRPYMQALPYNDVSYCMYGFRYQKTTRIWNNLPWVPGSQPTDMFQAQPLRSLPRWSTRQNSLATRSFPACRARGSSSGPRSPGRRWRSSAPSWTST